jgi:predicted enzyme related to lactoylglutathione lyase
MANGVVAESRLKEAVMDKHGVVHFEIYADDPEKLAGFYKDLFGWGIDAVPGMDYRFVKTVSTNEQGMPVAPGGINGGLTSRPMPEARFWLNYVNVDSVETSLHRAQQLGATAVRGKTAVPGMGWFAVLSDPQGNPFGLWQTDSAAQ